MTTSEQQAEKEQQQLAGKWKAFYDAKRALYLVVPSSARPAQATATTAYCLTLLDACNIPIPPAAFEGLGCGADERLFVEHRFHLSFYDLTAAAFFGNTFVSATIPGNAKVAGSTTGNPLKHDSVVLKHAVFFHSTITDPSCIAVFELILVLKNGDGVALRELSGGWGVFCPFGTPSRLRDIQDGEAARVSGATEQVYVGSPRLLPFIGAADVASLKQQLVPLQGCRFAYTLHTNKALKPAAGLFKENEIIDDNSVIPGLGRAPTGEESLPMTNSTPSPYVPSKYLFTPLDSPIFIPTVTMYVGEVVVSVSPGLVADLLEEFRAIRLHEYGLPQQHTIGSATAFVNAAFRSGIDETDGESVSIIQKYVSYGIHNGRTFVRAPHRGILEDRDGNLVHDNSLAFSCVFPHVLLAIVFQVEFVVRMPLPTKTQQLFGHPGPVERNVVLGWTAFVPFNGLDFAQGHVALDLQIGPGRSPYDDALVFAPKSKALEDGVPPISLAFSLKVPDFRPDGFGDDDEYEVPSRVPDTSRLDYSTIAASTGAVDARFPSEQTQEPSLVQPKSSSPRPVATGTRSPSQSRLQPRSPTAPQRRPESPKQQQKRPALETNRSEYPSVPTKVGSKPHPKPTFEVPRGKFHQVTAEDGKVPEEVRADPVATPGALQEPLSTATTALGRSGPRIGDSGSVLKGNEIHVQFVGTSLSQRSLFFTFRFWRYPMVRTRKISVCDPAVSATATATATAAPTQQQGPRLLCDVESDGTTTCGLGVRFGASGKNFEQYLATKCLQIDVWDGDSLFHLGDVVVELKHILRRGRKAVQLTDSFEIVFSERIVSGGSGNAPTQIATRQRVRGMLYMRLSNIGCSLERVGELSLESSLVVSQPRSSQSSSEIVDAMKLADKHAELKKQLMLLRGDATSPQSQPRSPHSMEEEAARRKKMARVEAARQAMGKTVPASEATTAQREQSLRVIQVYRDKRKAESVSSKLRGFVTTDHTIYPSLGSASFFEFEFRNPYPEEHTFTVQITDPELSVIKGFDEWMAFRKAHGIQTSPTERQLFVADDNTVSLQPKEGIRIPFKFQSFCSGAIVPELFQPDNSILCTGARFQFTQQAAIEKRRIDVSLCNSRGCTIAEIAVNVEPQNPVVDQTFWFVHHANDLFKQAIRVQPGSSARVHAQTFVHCSSQDVIFNAQRNAQGALQEVSFKCQCLCSGEAKSFFFLLYGDRFGASLQECWQVIVDVYDNQEISGQAGQSVPCPILVRGTQNSVIASCHSSCREVECQLEEVSLAPEQQNEIPLRFAPLRPGRREVLVHIVDESRELLAHGRMLYASATTPPITRAFKIDLGTSKSPNKRVSYTNPFGGPKTLLLGTSEPELLRFREDSIPIGPHETKQIGLVFIVPERPQAAPALVLVFINDSDTDKTLDCLAITVSYTTPK